MQSLETQYLIQHEQYQDRLREIEHQHLVAQCTPRPTNSRRWIGWFGRQMIRFGAKLAQYDASIPVPKAS